MTDINRLANEIYNGEVREKKATPKQSAPVGNVSDYHNQSLRGESALSGEDGACAYLESQGYKILKRTGKRGSAQGPILASERNR